MGDGYLMDGQVRPELGEHPSARPAMTARDAVAETRQPHSHDRHVEGSVGRFGGLVAQGHEIVETHSALFGPGTQVALHQRPGEAVDSGGHRCVGREHRVGTHRLHGLCEAQAVLHYERPDSLESHEPCMAFVGVEHIGCRSHRLESPNPADSEHQLLAESVLHVPAVEAVGHQAQVRGVLREIRVQQVERDPAQVHSPDPEQHLAAGQLHRHRVHAHLGHGHGVRVGVDEALVLPAVHREVLVEVAVAVEQPHCDQRHAHVAGGLHVIGGEHPEPS